MLLRAYFDLDLHKPFLIIKQKILKAIENYKEARDQNFKEYEKRKHTNELKSKIRLDSDSLTQDKPVEVDKRIENNEEIIDDPKNAFPHSGNYMSTGNYHENATVDSGSNATDDLDEDTIDAANESATDDFDENKAGESISDLNIEEMAKNTEVDIDEVEERKKPKRKYILPSSDLLKNPVSISCLLYTSPSPRDGLLSRMPSSA